MDLGAEKRLTAEREGQRIAVEIKNFLSRSPVKDLESTLGQYIPSQRIMAFRGDERPLYLAIRDDVYLDIFSEPIGRIFIENHQLKIIVFDSITEEIVRWIH